MKKYIFRVTKYLIAQVLLDLVSVVCFAVGPLIQEWIFDNGVNALPKELAVVMLCYILLLGGSSLASYFCTLFSFKGAIEFEKLLKKDYFNTVFHLSDEKFRQKDIGEYVSFQANDITALEQDYLQPFVDIVQSINRVVIYSVTLFCGIDWRMAIIILLATILTLTLSRVNDKRLIEKRRAYQDQVSKYTVIISDLLEGFRLISLRTIKQIGKRHEESLNQTAETRLEYGKAKSLSIGINEGAINLLRLITFSSIVVLFCVGELTIGAAVATLSYISAFIDPINALLYDYSTMQSMKKIKDNYDGFVNHSEETVKREFPTFNCRICLEDVCFHKENFSLEHVNCVFEKKKKYAIIGPSGSGKSTLLKLIMGYETPSSGRVSMDGTDVAGADLSRVITYLDQDEHVFKSDVDSNATIFHTYPDWPVKAALPDTRLEAFSALLGRTDVEDCQILSGGEREMICFLRVLAKNTEIVLMDEPFSALDPRNRTQIEDFILTSEHFCGKTVLMVTHNADAETLRRFDGVVQVKDGVVQESKMARGKK